MLCYQEVPVMDLCPECTEQYRFDWYIETLNTVIELHGEQHFKPCAFGTISYEQKMNNFQNMQIRDQRKKEFAIIANLRYVVIPWKYKNKLSGDLLREFIFKE